MGFGFKERDFSDCAQIPTTEGEQGKEGRKSQASRRQLGIVEE